MNRFWYSVILYLAFPLLIIYLAIRAIKSPDYRNRWSERFGLKPLHNTDVLIHTASMGETIAALPLIRKILESKPDIKVTVTTTSPTGSAEVVKALGNQVQHSYLPVDIAWCVQRFLKQLQPATIIILETELWPNLLHFANKSNINVLLANARLSEKSALNYQKWPKLTADIMSSIDCIAVQTQAEQDRFISLGLPAENIQVTGSLKFDVSIKNELIAMGQGLRKAWSKDNAPVWIAASVHPGEFEAILNAHQQLLETHPNALLIMVPRHPEKFEQAATAIKQHHLVMSRRSLDQAVTADTQVLLGDTMGELVMFCTAADQAFIGGSLIDHGGQNPLEAAAVGLGLVMGDSRYNFTDICLLLSQSGAMTTCNDASSLATALAEAFDEPERLQRRQQQAKAIVAANKGAVDKQFALFEALNI